MEARLARRDRRFPSGANVFGRFGAGFKALWYQHVTYRTINGRIWRYAGQKTNSLARSKPGIATLEAASNCGRNDDVAPDFR